MSGFSGAVGSQTSRGQAAGCAAFARLLMPARVNRHPAGRDVQRALSLASQMSYGTIYKLTHENSMEQYGS